MLKNYCKVALRNMAKRKLYALINILSLALGIACSVLVLLYVHDELTFDDFQKNRDHIHIPVSRMLSSSTGRDLVMTPGAAAGPTLLDEIPEITNCVRMTTVSAPIVCEGQAYRELLTFADTSLFDVLTFPAVAGSGKQALVDPGGIVLTQSKARMLFGTEDVIGRTVTAELGGRQHAFTVRAVLADIPANSSVLFDILVPFARVVDVHGPEFLMEFYYGHLQTFLLVSPDVAPSVLASKVAAVMAKHVDPELMSYELLAFSNLHLDENSILLSSRVSSPTYSWVLSAIAVAVLLIACINFMTLAIVRSADRNREIGIRKVVGAVRGQLATQFWAEAFVMAGAALALGIALAELFLPAFNTLAGKELTLGVSSGTTVWLGLIGIALAAGLIAGSYPALFLSRLRPVIVFHHRFTLGGAGPITRLLVVLQFTLSLVLLVSMWVMSEQLHYLRGADLGYRDNMLVTLSVNTEDAESLYQRYRNEVIDHPSVVGMTTTDAAFTGRHLTSMTLYVDDKELAINLFAIDYDFLGTVGLDLVAGRNFSREHATDPEEAIIINETMAGRLGGGDALGKPFAMGPEQRPVSVVGVVRDFHFISMRHRIAPVILHLRTHTPIRYIYVRIDPGNVPATLSFLRDRWKAVAPHLPFDHHFADEYHDRLYSAEERWATIVRYASALALVTACLGLIGLSALTAQKRRREVSIRKVHGASVTSILALLGRHYVILIAMAAILAWPLGYVLMNRWLSGFAYHIAIGIVPFVISGLIVLTVALLAVGYQVIRVARSNPADILRCE